MEKSAFVVTRKISHWYFHNLILSNISTFAQLTRKDGELKLPPNIDDIRAMFKKY